MIIDCYSTHDLHVLQSCFLASPPPWLCAVGVTALEEELHLALLNCIHFSPVAAPYRRACRCSKH